MFNPYEAPNAVRREVLRPSVSSEEPERIEKVSPPRPQVTITDYMIFTYALAFSIVVMAEAEDLCNGYPTWSRYAASALYAGFVTFWSWVLDWRVQAEEFAGFVARIVLVMIYCLATCTIGYITSICIVYPSYVSLVVVPTGLTLYAASLGILNIEP